MARGVIYRHWHIDKNGQEKSYVGLHTTDNPQKRWGKNGYGYKTQTFWDVICEYGWDNFYHDIIEVVECEDKNELVKLLTAKETYWISYYNSFYSGYNNTAGGEGCLGRKHTEDERIKMSLFWKEKWKDEDFRKKNHKSQKQSWENEQRKSNASVKMRNLRNNPDSIYNTQDYKQKHRESMEKVYTDEIVRAKHSQSAKDNWANPNSGYNNEDCRRKMSEAKIGKYIGVKNPNAKCVVCVNTQMVFKTRKEASEWCGVSGGAISMCCTHKRKTAGKHPNTNEPLKWMYYEEFLTTNENSEENVI